MSPTEVMEGGGLTSYKPVVRAFPHSECAALALHGVCCRRSVVSNSPVDSCVVRSKEHQGQTAVRVIIIVLLSIQTHHVACRPACVATCPREGGDQIECLQESQKHGLRLVPLRAGVGFQQSVSSAADCQLSILHWQARGSLTSAPWPLQLFCC